MTLNNPSEIEKTDLIQKCDLFCNKYRIQTEVGSCGTPHLQGVVTMKKKTRMTELTKWNHRIHWEKSKSEAAVAYCSKQDTSTGEFWSKGYPRPVKTLPPEALYPWQLEICKILESPPNDRKIYWFWGPTNIGKTTFCKYLTITYKAIALSGKCADMKNGVIQYTQTNGDTPEIIIIPIPKTFNYDYISYDGIESVKDMYFYSGKYEGGMICGNCPHLLIFANEPPRDREALAKDRWVVTHINPQFST